MLERARMRLLALAVLALVAACGMPGTGSSPSPSAATSTPSPIPAGLIFKLSAIKGGVKTTATGTIKVIAQPGQLTIELKITGLPAASIHVSHIHIGSCKNRGSIYRALNTVVADGQGTADTKSTVNASYPPKKGTTWYVVVHVGPDMQGTNSLYLLCGNLFK
jgi:Cu/Zn superoxide dismutase